MSKPHVVGVEQKILWNSFFSVAYVVSSPKLLVFFFRLQSQRQTESHGAPSPSFSFNNLMRVQKFPSQKSHNSQSISNICIFCVSALSELLTTLVLRGWIVWCVMWNGNHSGWGYVMIQSEIRGKLVVYVMFHGALDTFEMSYGESQLRPNMWANQSFYCDDFNENNICYATPWRQSQSTPFLLEYFNDFMTTWSRQLDLISCLYASYLLALRLVFAFRNIKYWKF